jgi:4-hydroxybenzoate polyprenyltransferase
MRLRDLAALVRLPNVFTAPADVAMGLAVSGAGFDRSAAFLFGASALAYAGGMALNDACDAELDAVERPSRPIPSGRISRTAAFLVAAALLGGALAMAAAAGVRQFAAAAGLVGAIVLYDTRARRTAMGPLVMALCRALDAGLGVAGGFLGWHVLGPLVLLFAWVLTITNVSRFETAQAPARVVRDAVASFGMVVGIAAVVLVQRSGTDGLPLLALLAWWMAAPVRAALAEPSPPRIIGVIKASVLGIILFDAAFVAGSFGLAQGLAVASLFVPAYYLGRRFASA